MGCEKPGRGLWLLSVVYVWMQALGCGGQGHDAAPAALCDAMAGGLQINEALPLPVGRTRYRQWLELHNTGSETLALDGAVLSIGTPWLMRHHTLAGSGTLAPGAFLLLGDGDAASRRRVAGLQVAYGYGDLPMPADAGVIELRCGAQPLAQLSYGTGHAAPVPEVGRALARQVDADGGVAYCRAAGPRYDGYDQGSPGRANPGCWLCEDGRLWRPQALPRAGTLTLEAGCADPAGPDRGREWLRLRATADGCVDLQDIALQIEVEGRPSRRWRLRTAGCTPLCAGAAITLPVGVVPREPAPALPFWAGPTLPNRALTFTLEGADGAVLDTGTLPRLPHHEGVWRQPSCRVPVDARAPAGVAAELGP